MTESANDKVETLGGRQEDGVTRPPARQKPSAARRKTRRVDFPSGVVAAAGSSCEMIAEAAVAAPVSSLSAAACPASRLAFPDYAEEDAGVPACDATVAATGTMPASASASREAHERVRFPVYVDPLAAASSLEKSVG